MKDELRDILEILHFMQDNMVTKDEFDRILDQRFMMFKTEIITTIDGFAKQMIRFDHELVAMQSRYERLDERVEVLESK